MLEFCAFTRRINFFLCHAFCPQRFIYVWKPMIIKLDEFSKSFKLIFFFLQLRQCCLLKNNNLNVDCKKLCGCYLYVILAKHPSLCFVNLQKSIFVNDTAYIVNKDQNVPGFKPNETCC